MSHPLDIGTAKEKAPAKPQALVLSRKSQLSEEGHLWLVFERFGVLTIGFDTLAEHKVVCRTDVAAKLLLRRL